MTISETFLSILPPESRAKIERLLLEQQAAHDLYVAASNRRSVVRRRDADPRAILEVVED
jgi:hypothetical protein